MARSNKAASSATDSIARNDSNEFESDDDSEAEDPSKLMLFVERFVVFGDSPLGLAASFILLLVAVGTALWINQEDLRENVSRTAAYKSLGPVPKIDPPKIFEVTPNGSSLVTDEIRAAFEKDGVVAVRGLLSHNLLDRLDGASNELVQRQQEKDKQRRQKRTRTQFHMVQMGAVFLDPDDAAIDNGGVAESDENNGKASSFRELSLYSPIPQFAAELLGLSVEKNDTLRMLRDIFLTKDEEEYVCGWHVDDLGFWPATASSPGVNAWVAIDDMPLASGGGFALAVGSHSAPWRDDAHRAIGSTPTFPLEGFKSAADMFENRTGGGTCNLETEAPHLHKRMEESRRVYEVQRGDVLFHTRWLFHRTVPFERSLVEKHSGEEETALLYRRYSVRYGPGSSGIPRGYGTELSVLWNAENGGRTADEVSLLDGPWYPKCWPSVSTEEMQQLGQLVKEKVPVAEERRKEAQKEMQPYLKKLSRTQGRSHGPRK